MFKEMKYTWCLYYLSVLLQESCSKEEVKFNNLWTQISYELCPEILMLFL